MTDRYARVIGSVAWIERKGEIVETRGMVCEECGVDGEEIELHHVTYENLGDERDEELVLLCGWCHGRAHHGWW